MPNTYINCFHGNYHAARHCVLGTLSHTPKELIQQQLAIRHPLPGADAQALFLDWIRLGHTENPQRLLVLICGTHGVEGFAGSAIQCGQWPLILDALQRHSDLGVIILHALNPWGFSWLRRYDHEGIDLNRNFIDFSNALPDNQAYHAMHRDLFTSPSQPVQDCLLDWQSKLGTAQYEAVITRGQYHYPDGLFYGGARPSWSRQTLQNLSADPVIGSAKRIAVIDLHTGLGPYGHGEIINDHSPGSVGFSWVERWYGKEGKSALLGESYSPPKTGLLDYFWHTLIGDRGCFVTLEFGTYELDKLLTLLCEEQRYHNSYRQDWRQRDIQHPAVLRLHEFFYPRDEQWQVLIQNRAQTVIELAVRGLTR